MNVRAIGLLSTMLATVGAGQAIEASSATARHEEAGGSPTTSLSQASLREVNGTRLYVRELGDGPPLIVLHGGPGWDHSIFLPHLEPLAADFRLILFDQRASGRSSILDVEPTEMTVARFIEDIDGVRRQLGLERVGLMGHSFGGRLAMQYAIEHPERVTSLLLVSPTAASSEYVERVNRTMQERLTPEDRRARDRLIADGAFGGDPPAAFKRLMRIILSANFHDPAGVERLDFLVADHFAERSERIEALMASSSPYDFHDDLSRIRARTLIVRGDAEALPAEATERLHVGIPSSTLVELERCGHFPFIECTEALVDAIRSYSAR